MKTYQEHYKESQQTYRGEHGPFAYPRAKLYDFTVREYGPSKSDNLIQVDDRIMSLIGDISDVGKQRFEDPNTHCWAPPGLDSSSDTMYRAKDVWNVSAIGELASLVMPQIESNLFGSYSIVDGLYFYRTVHKEAPEMRGSLLWHYDNHIKERIKILFYLNDVTEESGPFEYLWNEQRSCGLKAETRRVDHTQWQKYHSRVGESEIQSLAEKGFRPKKMIGSPGTFAMFDNNCVHRANVPSPGTHRDVFVLMFRPYHEKLHPHIDKRWTGTNYHSDTNTNPEDREVTKR
mgnify:CR=1 FL=1